MTKLRTAEELQLMVNAQIEPTLDLAKHLENCVAIYKPVLTLNATADILKGQSGPAFPLKGLLIEDNKEKQTALWLLSNGRFAETKRSYEYGGSWTQTMKELSFQEVADNYEVAHCVEVLYQASAAKAPVQAAKLERVRDMTQPPR